MLTSALSPHERLIVALDVPTLEEAESLADRLVGSVGWFKVGSSCSRPTGPRRSAPSAAHGPVFLDVKLHDIPTTVERAAAASPSSASGW
jgi:orotidine-5'-phosphate decarboxylase